MATWARIGAAVMAAAAAGSPAMAQGEAQWAPGRTVRLMIPFTPGGAADILGRLLTNQISQATGQNTIVENRPGGGTVIATEVVARAAPDGTTLLLMANSFVINDSLRKLTYEPLKSFEHICFLAQSPHVLTVPNASAIRTFADFVKASKDKPGAVTVGAVGPATTHHIAIEMLKRSAAIDVTFVSFPGGSAAATNVIGGHLAAALTNFAEIKENIGPAVRAIAVGPAKRLKELPEIPTFAELGHPDVIGVSWFGLVAPAGTPADVVQRITKAFQAGLADRDVATKAEAAGVVIEGTCGPQFGELLRAQHGRYARAIREAGIKEK